MPAHTAKRVIGKAEIVEAFFTQHTWLLSKFEGYLSQADKHSKATYMLSLGHTALVNPNAVGIEYISQAKASSRGQHYDRYGDTLKQQAIDSFSQCIMALAKQPEAYMNSKMQLELAKIKHSRLKHSLNLNSATAQALDGMLGHYAKAEQNQAQAKLIQVPSLLGLFKSALNAVTTYGLMVAGSVYDRFAKVFASAKPVSQPAVNVITVEEAPIARAISHHSTESTALDKGDLQNYSGTVEGFKAAGGYHDFFASITTFRNVAAQAKQAEANRSRSVSAEF